MTSLAPLTLWSQDSLASPPVLPGSDEARMMTAGSGRKYIASLPLSGPVGFCSKILLASSVWASKRCLLTWKGKTIKTRAMKRKHGLFQLVPLALHTSESASLSWPTPKANAKEGYEAGIRHWEKWQSCGLETAARMWPTPTAIDSGTGRVNRSQSAGAATRPTLAYMANKNLWPTPQARDGKGTSGPNHQFSPTLPDTVLWATPAAQDGKNSTLPPSQAGRQTLPGDLLRSGEEGRLNPAWVECLMGFPAGWTDIGGPLRQARRKKPGNRQESREKTSLTAPRA